MADVRFSARCGRWGQIGCLAPSDPALCHLDSGFTCARYLAVASCETIHDDAVERIPPCAGGVRHGPDHADAQVAAEGPLGISEAFVSFPTQHHFILRQQVELLVRSVIEAPHRPRACALRNLTRLSMPEKKLDQRGNWAREETGGGSRFESDLLRCVCTRFD